MQRRGEAYWKERSVIRREVDVVDGRASVTILTVTLTPGSTTWAFSPLLAIIMTHKHATSRGRRSLDPKAGLKTDGRKDTTDRITFLALWRKALDLRLKTSRVRILAVPLSGNNLGQVVHTRVPLSPRFVHLI